MAVAAPLTPSRFGSSLQHGSIAFPGDALAVSLPSVDFGFNELREQMAAFTLRFDDFIARGRKRVLDQRNEFRMNTAELHESQRARRQAIQDCEAKSANHAHTVEKEAQEMSELQIAIQSLQQQKEDQLQRKATLQAEVQVLQAELTQRKDAQAAHNRALEAQARLDLPELRTWEQLLGLRIEGAGAGTEQLRFIFKGVDKRDEHIEAWFDMNFAARDTRIVQTRPLLRQEDISALESRFSLDRDVQSLLKRMRNLFIEVLDN